MTKLKEIYKIAEENLKRDGYLVPAILASGTIDDKETTSFYVISLRDQTEKLYNFFLAGIKSQEEGLKIKNVIFISEAWMRCFSKDNKDAEEIKKILAEGVSSSENKMEVMICVMAGVNKKTSFSYREFRRVGKDIYWIGDAQKMKDCEANSILFANFWDGYYFSLNKK